MAERDFPQLGAILAGMREDDRQARAGDQMREERISTAEVYQKEDYRFLSGSDVTGQLKKAGTLLADYYGGKYPSEDRGKVLLSITDISNNPYYNVDLKLIWDLLKDGSYISGRFEVQDLWKEVSVQTVRNGKSGEICGLRFDVAPVGALETPQFLTTSLSFNSIRLGVDYAVSNPIQKRGRFWEEYSPDCREEIPLTQD